jgi:hypothetical protein
MKLDGFFAARPQKFEIFSFFEYVSRKLPRRDLNLTGCDAQDLYASNKKKIDVFDGRWHSFLAFFVHPTFRFFGISQKKSTVPPNYFVVIRFSVLRSIENHTNISRYRKFYPNFGPWNDFWPFWFSVNKSRPIALGTLRWKFC